MTHYTSTRGWVLQTHPYGENDLLVTLLTEEGVVTARAASARKETSTLRLVLVPGYLLTITLARTLKSTRITGAVIEEAYIAFPHACTLLVRGGVLITRLSHGEGEPKLFQVVSDVVRYAPHLEDEEDVLALECILALRILATLGYASPRTFGTLTLDLIREARSKRSLYVKRINETLALSHL
jgi:recombinational DNA repair protein (RecF pathway)